MLSQGWLLMHIRIQNETYQLMEGETQLPFTEILKDCDGKYSKAYPLCKEYDSKIERVGTIRVRDLLLIEDPELNPIFQSLRELRGEAYDWAAFVKARKQKVKRSKKDEEP